MKGQNPVSAMFGRIAGVYDLLNHVLSLGIDISWRRQLAELAPNGTILDLAAGTLDVALALQTRWPDARILAMDFCEPMLAKGMRKLAARPGSAIFPVCANALALPLANDCLNAITIAFGIRNIPDRPQAFAEMLRALSPGGRACILEFGSASERIWGGVYNFYLANILPRIGRAVAHDQDAYDYLARTIRNFPTARALQNEMDSAGFINTGFRRLSGGIVCLHWGEKPPQA